jgi:hypothetical protein
VGLNSLKSLNLTNVYPNNKNNKVKSKPLEPRSRVKNRQIKYNLYFFTPVPYNDIIIHIR